MVIEAGLVAGYVIAWAVGKARRAAGRLDAVVDAAIDGGLDQLHQVVAAKLGPHPVLEDLADELGEADGQVSDLTRRQVELAVTAAARKDDAFGRAVTALVAQLRAAERAAGVSVVAGSGSTILTGAAHAEARDGGVAFGQVGGDVHIDKGGERPGPPGPGR
ncbi:chromosome partitioning protein [Dactylosporangium sp. CA-139066]|uniref:chromosome partitioning protein n=1 Tax=Dactylosporangium sp. CA-139066 TaxID=3239930 RepID=UPI003D8C17FE